MKLQTKELDQFLGIYRNMDPTQVPFGGAVTCQNLAQYTPTRLQRIAGLIAQTPVNIDSSISIPLIFEAKELAGVGQPDRIIGVFVGGNGVATLVNLSLGVAMTGPALIGSATDNWTYQFYANQHTLAGGGNGILQLTGDTTYISLIAAGTQNGTVTKGSAVITGLADTSHLLATQPVSGSGIPAGSTIVSVDSGTQVTISNTITPVSFTGTGLTRTSGSNVLVAGCGAVLNGTIYIGDSVSGTGIPANTVVTNVQYLPHRPGCLDVQITMNHNATSSSTNATATFGATIQVEPITFTPTAPTGDLIQSFQDRLYIAAEGSNEGLLFYTDNLTMNVQALDFVNTREAPGPITGLSVYSPSTSALGIRSALLIFKRNGIWMWDEASKDVLTAKIGSLSPRTIINTPAGVMFLGKRGNLNSVFVIPLGMMGFGRYHFGEPIDVGKNLYNFLNGPNGITAGTEVMAHAVVDDKFYKLFLSVGGDNTNATELWLDLDALTSSPLETVGTPPPPEVWYGPHTRGSIDASTIASSGLYLASGNAAAQPVWFLENPDRTTGFIDTNGNVLQVLLDMPINVEPLDFEKHYDIGMLHIAPESNTITNTINSQVIADNDPSYPSVPLLIYNPSAGGSIVHVIVPLYGPGETGEAAHHLRDKFTHTLNTRLDILGFTLQYYVFETDRIYPQLSQNGVQGVNK